MSLNFIVCGSRNWHDADTIRREIMNLWANFGADSPKIIHGGCRGADLIAERVANEIGFRTEQCRANWTIHGRAAGPIRNAWMLKEFKPRMVIAFAIRLSGGTFDMITKARKAGVEVRIVRSSSVTE